MPEWCYASKYLEFLNADDIAKEICPKKTKALKSKWAKLFLNCQMVSQ